MRESLANAILQLAWFSHIFTLRTSATLRKKHVVLLGWLKHLGADDNLYQLLLFLLSELAVELPTTAVTEGILNSNTGGIVMQYRKITGDSGGKSYDAIGTASNNSRNG